MYEYDCECVSEWLSDRLSEWMSECFIEMVNE